MSITHEQPQRTRGRKPILTDEDKIRLYGEFVQLGRLDTMNALAERWGISRATLYNVIASQKAEQAA